MTRLGAELGLDLSLRLGANLSGGESDMDRLLAAANWHAFFDFDFGYTLSGGNVAALASRVNGHTVEQASGPSQPAWGAESPTGKKGATFDGSNDFLSGAPDLAALLAGTAEYSALWIVQFSSVPGDRVVWGASDSGSSLNTVFEGMAATTGADLRWRGDTASSSANGGAHTTDLALVTTNYAGGVYQSWINETLAVNGAVARSPTVDVFSIGARRQSGSWSRYHIGAIWGVGIATPFAGDQLATSRALAKTIWGTP